ncbi:MAG: orotidine-5'-phosphate decarboxylase [Candidatus Bipolaricaulota bacterium]
MNKFKRRIANRSTELNSNLVFALDISRPLYSLPKSEREEKRTAVYEEAFSILQGVEEHIAAVKVNYPLLLTLGPDLTSDLLDQFGILAIADFKVADIDNTCKWIGIQAMEMGFDAIIAHPFVGYEKGLSGLFQATREQGGGIILVINMSHPGSKQFITPNAKKLAEFAVDNGADGVVAPATRPEEVSRARTWVGEELLLFTPGVGAQGGKPGDAVSAGADYEIVGRAIYQADRPAESAERLKKQIGKASLG